MVFVVQVLHNTTHMNKNGLYKFTYFPHYVCCVIQETSLETPVTVFDIPEASCRRQIAERLNVSLHFPAADWLVLGDGAGRLYLIDTADRTHNDQWQVRVVVLLVTYIIVFFCPRFWHRGLPIWLIILLLHRPLSRRLDRCDRMIQIESMYPNLAMCACFQQRHVRHNANYVPYSQIRFDLSVRGSLASLSIAIAFSR